MKCLCGHYYVKEDRGKEICPHCFPTKKGFQAVKWAADEVFGRRRALLFTKEDESEIYLEVLRDGKWVLEGVSHPSPGHGEIELERMARANSLSLMEPATR